MVAVDWDAESYCWHVRGSAMTHYGPRWDSPGGMRRPTGQPLRCGKVIDATLVEGSSPAPDQVETLCPGCFPLPPGLDEELRAL